FSASARMRFTVIAFALLLTKFAKSQTIIGPCVGGQCPPPAVCLNATDQCVVFTVTTAPPTTCVDKVGPNGVSDCPYRSYLCTNALYSALMRDQCPRTCGYCTGSSSTTCVDLAAPGQASTCPGQSYLCQNAVYRELMRVQCPRTCGYCT
uniref:ShKT domain-containing protein n=1 Tax=Parascaris univalens TaxID=6257 RepID=A0A915CI04_PARUN